MWKMSNPHTLVNHLRSGNCWLLVSRWWIHRTPQSKYGEITSESKYGEITSESKHGEITSQSKQIQWKTCWHWICFDFFRFTWSRCTWGPSRFPRGRWSGHRGSSLSSSWKQELVEEWSCLLFFLSLTCAPFVGIQELFWCLQRPELCTQPRCPRGRRFWDKWSTIGEVPTIKRETSEENLWQSIPIDDLPLLLNKHRHVHEHLVELLDRRLQLHEHLVPDDQGSRNLGWNICKSFKLPTIWKQALKVQFYTNPPLTVVRCHWWLPWVAPHCPLYGYVLSVVLHPLPEISNLTWGNFQRIQSLDWRE